jgi:D-glycero-D-manno-heptose 1,7-bisphosphate phosphatase
MNRKAAFFDRDGTLIEHVHFLSRCDQVALIPAAVDYAQWLRDQGYMLFMVTNQSGVARGYFDETAVKLVNNYVMQLYADAGVIFTQAYYCPHHPDSAAVAIYQQDCLCRKPLPGMLHQAATEHGINLAASLMIGDSAIDIAAGKAAGCKSLHISELFDKTDQDYATLTGL